MAFTTSQASLKGGPLQYHVGGTGDPVLYLHTAGGVRLSPALDALARSHQLYLPVMPGFDGTARNAGLRSMPDLADLAASFIDGVIKRPCDVIGHSFGGWVATWLAVRHPDKVQQLVLAAPAGFRPEGQGGLIADPAKLRRMMFAHPENLPPEQKTSEILAQNRATASHYNGEAATDRDLAARLGEINALTLILHGTKDGVIPIASPHLLKERIPRSHLVYLYDAAHALDVDQPQRYVQLIDDFLARGEAFIVHRPPTAA
jgi:pimeloyl-ACP methyl ester carboxylesterase